MLSPDMPRACSLAERIARARAALVREARSGNQLVQMDVERLNVGATIVNVPDFTGMLFKMHRRLANLEPHGINRCDGGCEGEHGKSSVHPDQPLPKRHEESPELR